MGKHFFCVPMCNKKPWLCRNCNISFIWSIVSVLWLLWFFLLIRLSIFHTCYLLYFLYSVCWWRCRCCWRLNRLMFEEEEEKPKRKSLTKRLFFTVYWLKDIQRVFTGKIETKHENRKSRWNTGKTMKWCIEI